MNKLLFITERFPPDIGGVASSAGRIVNGFVELGIEVDILTWSRYLQPGELLRPKENIPQIYRIGLYRNWDMTMPHTLNILEWMHQSNSYQAIWGHYLFPGGFLAAWFASLQNISCTVSARGNDIDRAMFPPGDFARLLWTLERANLITAVSQDMANKIKLLCRRNDIFVLKNSVNPHIFSRSTPSTSQLEKLRSQLGIADHEVILGFSGELREKKGQHFLLNALSTVHSVRPACLLIIGEIRPVTEAILQTYVSQNPEAGQRIIITGHLPNPEQVAQHLQLCDVFLLPSLWEGMPNSLLEAMACECCCIASDAGGIPEIIEHQHDGFLLPKSQLHRLGEAILEYLELSTECRQQIKKNARNKVLQKFSPEQEKERLQNILTLL
jgi:glycosyltransferase involved in cell wall biosynthesis